MEVILEASNIIIRKVLNWVLGAGIELSNWKNCVFWVLEALDFSLTNKKKIK